MSVGVGRITVVTPLVLPLFWLDKMCFKMNKLIDFVRSMYLIKVHINIH